MKKFFILFLVILPIIGFSQVYDRGIFYVNTDSNAVNDTLAISGDSLETVVYWPGWRSMRGSLTLHGEVYILSGNSPRTITVHIWPLHDTEPNDLGTMQTLGTITVTDSIEFEYNVAGESWWQFMKGYQVSFVPDSTTSQIRHKVKELAR
jgi:hypothetical protein